MQLTQQLNTTIITWRRVPTSPDVLDSMIMMKNEQEDVGEVKREEKDAPRFLCWFISLNLPHKHEYLYNLYFVHSLELQFVSGPCVRVSCGPATRPPSQFAEQPTHPERSFNETMQDWKTLTIGKKYFVNQVLGMPQEAVGCHKHIVENPTTRCLSVPT